MIVAEKSRYGSKVTITTPDQTGIIEPLIVTVAGAGRESAVFGATEVDRVERIRDELNEWIKSVRDDQATEVYWVRSESRPAMNHRVTRRRNAVWDCSCEDYRNRGGTCKHIVQARTERGNR